MILTLLFGCGGGAPEGYAAVIAVDGDQVEVGNAPAGDWADRAFFLERTGPGTYRDAVSAAVAKAKSAGKPAVLALDVPPGATFGDVWQLLAPAAVAGASGFGIRDARDVYNVFPLSIPAVAPPAAGAPVGADVFGVMSVRFDGTTTWLEGEAAFAVRRAPDARAALHAGDPGTGLPVDCAAVYPTAPALEQACLGGRRDGGAAAVALGGPISCIVTPTMGDNLGSAWSTEVASTLKTLDPRAEHVWTITADPAAPAAVLAPILEGFVSAGLAPPGIAEPLERPTLGLPDCTGAVHDSRSLDAAAAAWLGSLKPAAPAVPPPDAPAPAAPAPPP